MGGDLSLRAIGPALPVHAHDTFVRRLGLERFTKLEGRQRLQVK
jgi:hypothetical protein